MLVYILTLVCFEFFRRVRPRCRSGRGSSKGTPRVTRGTLVSSFSRLSAVTVASLVGTRSVSVSLYGSRASRLIPVQPTTGPTVSTVLLTLWNHPVVREGVGTRTMGTKQGTISSRMSSLRSRGREGPTLVSTRSLRNQSLILTRLTPPPTPSPSSEAPGSGPGPLRT